jgi:hypothetical protein
VKIKYQPTYSGYSRMTSDGRVIVNTDALLRSAKVVRALKILDGKIKGQARPLPLGTVSQEG